MESASSQQVLEAKAAFNALQTWVKQSTGKGSRGAYEAVKTLAGLSKSKGGRCALTQVAGLMDTLTNAATSFLAEHTKRRAEMDDLNATREKPKFSKGTESLVEAVEIFVRMARADEQSKFAMTNCGGVAVMLKALVNMEGHPGVRLAACAGLRDLCATSSLREKVLDEGAIDSVLLILQRLQTTERQLDLRLECMMVLVALLDSPRGKEEVLSKGVGYLVAVLLGARQTMLQLTAAAGIALCLDGPEGCYETVISIGGPAAVVHCADILLQAAESGQVQTSEDGALAKIVQTISNKIEESQQPPQINQEAGNSSPLATVVRNQSVASLAAKKRILSRFHHSKKLARPEEEGFEGPKSPSSEAVSSPKTPANPQSGNYNIRGAAVQHLDIQGHGTENSKDKAKHPKPFGWKFRGSSAPQPLKRSTRDRRGVPGAHAMRKVKVASPRERAGEEPDWNAPGLSSQGSRSPVGEVPIPHFQSDAEREAWSTICAYLNESGFPLPNQQSPSTSSPQFFTSIGLATAVPSMAEVNFGMNPHDIARPDIKALSSNRDAIRPMTGTFLPKRPLPSRPQTARLEPDLDATGMGFRARRSSDKPSSGPKAWEDWHAEDTGEAALAQGLSGKAALPKPYPTVSRMSGDGVLPDWWEQRESKPGTNHFKFGRPVSQGQNRSSRARTSSGRPQTSAGLEGVGGAGWEGQDGFRDQGADNLGFRPSTVQDEKDTTGFGLGRQRNPDHFLQGDLLARPSTHEGSRIRRGSSLREKVSSSYLEDDQSPLARHGADPQPVTDYGERNLRFETPLKSPQNWKNESPRVAGWEFRSPRSTKMLRSPLDGLKSAAFDPLRG